MKVCVCECVYGPRIAHTRIPGLIGSCTRFPFDFTVCTVLATSQLLGLPPGTYDHGVVHSVSCNTGYSLIGGASSITCSDGNWVPADVTCFEGIVVEVRKGKTLLITRSRSACTS